MEDFTVIITETLSRRVTVTANDVQDAYDQVKYSYDEQDIVLDAEDFDEVKLTVE